VITKSIGLMWLGLGLCCLLPLAGCGPGDGDQPSAEQKSPAKSPESKSPEGKSPAEVAEKTPADLGEAALEAMAKGFEESFQEAFDPENMAAQARTEALAETERIAAMEAVDVAQFEAGWKAALDARGRPAGEVLTQLAEQVGLVAELPPQFAEALATPVSVDVTGKSCLEAIENVCTEVGLHPVYPALESPRMTFFQDDSKEEEPRNRLSLAAGPRKFPVAFAGPLLWEVTRVEEFPPNGTGTLFTALRAYGLPPMVVYALREKSGSALEGIRISDAQGRDLYDDGDSGVNWPLEKSQSAYEVPVQVPLKNLVQATAVLPPIQAGVNLSLPVRIEAIEFDTLQAGTTGQAEGVELTLKKMTESNTTGFSDQRDGYSLEFQFKGGSSEQIHFVAYDAEGNLLPTDRESSWSMGEQGSVEIGVTGSPAKIVARVIVEQAEMAYAFELRDVALASASQQPVSIEPANFPGHDCPVTVEFVEFRGEPDFRKLLLRVTNHADQDIRNLSMLMEYFDAAGEKLKDWPASESGTTDMDTGEISPCVEKQVTAELEVAAFFMPDETESVKVTPTEIEFSNATVWQRPEAESP